MEDRYTGTGIIAINNRLRRLARNVDFTWSYVFSRETHLPTAVFPRGVHPTRFIHAATYQKIRETGSPDVPFSILDTLSLYFVINDSVLSLFSFFFYLSYFFFLSSISLSSPLSLSSSRQIFSSFKFAETRIDRQFAKIQFSMGLKLGCSRGERKSAREKKICKKIYSSTRSEITTSLPKSIK